MSGAHEVGVVHSIQAGRWMTYCVQCSANSQLWVSPCEEGRWGEPPPPAYLFELAVMPNSTAEPATEHTAAKIAPADDGLKE